MHETVTRAINRAAGAFLGLLLAAILALAGLGFLVGALYLALTTVLAPPMAAALCGVVALLLSLLVLLAVRRRARPGSRRDTTARPTDDGPASGDPGGLVAAWLPALRTHAPQLAAGAFAVGVVFGVSPRARRRAWRLLDRLLDGG